MTSTPSRSLSLIAALMLSAAAAACGQDAGAPGQVDATQTPAPSAQAPTAPPPEPAKINTNPATSSSASASATPAASRKSCYLSVDGKVLLDEPCLVYPFGDGGYTMNAWSEGKPKNSHFAVVVLMADGSADATWNADPDDDKAGDRLGTVRLNGDCWINDRARICTG
ncbi:hypothetical protein [uncultured Brevundimonas sp.]|uniref:hypothetical protein n=1 Tax=uncultured Brevundimonas sp. TaxID=213418 RepID=UPI0025E72B59|nr:hypothetical protein [uncultured Brevundimonas sp.]